MEGARLNNPEQVKSGEKKDKGRPFSQHTTTFLRWTIKSHHRATILTTLALQFLPSYLFLWRNNGFFQQAALPSRPTLSFSLLLSSSSVSPECRVPTTGFEVGLEGELIIMEKRRGEREWGKRYKRGEADVERGLEGGRTVINQQIEDKNNSNVKLRNSF